MPTPYRQATLDWICCNKDYIKQIASSLDVPAEAIAGLMAKENNSFMNHVGIAVWAENLATSLLTWSNEAIYQAYNDHKDDIGPGKITKVLNPILIDIGPANIQTCTAVRLINDYMTNYPNDPYGLKEYNENPRLMVATLTDWLNTGKDPAQCQDAAARLSTVLTGLMVKEALKFCQEKADPQWWSWASSDSVFRDAILVTYCVNGKAWMERNYEDQKAAWEKDHPDDPFRYVPWPGGGVSGGEDHIYNACRIGRALLNISYGGESCALPWSRCFVASLDPETCEVVYRRLPCPPPPWPPHIAPPRLDPLILDLDGDGIETTHVAGQTYFDQDGDGLAERTGWVGSDDGLLVLDRNGNGMIDNGTELFGNQAFLQNGAKAANGFQGLADLDDNHDGRIDANDPDFALLQELDTNGDGAITAADTQFGELRVWRDLNQDGICTTDELSALAQNQIVSIGVDPATANQHFWDGDTITAIGTFIRSDGTIGGLSKELVAANLNL